MPKGRKTSKLRGKKKFKKKCCNKVIRKMKKVGQGKRDYRKDPHLSTYYFRT